MKERGKERRSGGESEREGKEKDLPGYHKFAQLRKLIM